MSGAVVQGFGGGGVRVLQFSFAEMLDVHNLFLFLVKKKDKSLSRTLDIPCLVHFFSFTSVSPAIILSSSPFPSPGWGKRPRLERRTVRGRSRGRKKIVHFFIPREFFCLLGFPSANKCTEANIFVLLKGFPFSWEFSWGGTIVKCYSLRWLGY